jgi:hypothetical protein
MKVTQKMTMKEYDAFTAHNLAQKVPDWQNWDIRRRLGDSIYDFSKEPPEQRKSVHNRGNTKTELNGHFALLSEHFFYFGDQPVPLSPDLMPIVKQGQGHRSTSNAPYFDTFVRWIHNLGFEENTVLGRPQIDLFSDECLVTECANACRVEGEEDLRSENSD